jgi:NhaP-type Na+/H+ or K+/H+ antiporter
MYYRFEFFSAIFAVIWTVASGIVFGGVIGWVIYSITKKKA